MLTTRIIPCLDCRDGRVVKGVQFQNLRDAGNPVELSKAYEKQGADELIILDVSATPEGRGHQVDTVKAVRKRLRIPLTCGGGVRRLEDASRLLDAGADKVSVNTAAVINPLIIDEMAKQFGSQCTILAIDAAWNNDLGSWEVIVRSGTERLPKKATDWAREAQERGCGEILLTSWDRDGTRSGYDLKMLTAIRAVVGIPIIASGGANSPQHMKDAIDVGVDAVLAASIFHDGDYTVDRLKKELRELGGEVRL
ncbi:MAG: imidazole glycerol phosphate synthase subunit HisF [Myxococcota bacterium]|nr:imidazole glycerol phosphate synthase subunit HisF [Myxococcota bacterium]